MATDTREHGSEDLMTYKYDRNRVYKVFAGTQCAYVRWRVGPRAGNQVRMEQQAQAVAEAVRIYEEHWGPIYWDLAQLLITHMTISISVELRVETV